MVVDKGQLGEGGIDAALCGGRSGSKEAVGVGRRTHPGKALEGRRGFRGAPRCEQTLDVVHEPARLGPGLSEDDGPNEHDGGRGQDPPEAGKM
jgi:hypothetical protein